MKLIHCNDHAAKLTVVKEIETMAKVKHDHCVPLMGYFVTEDDHVGIVMEKYHGIEE